MTTKIAIVNQKGGCGKTGLATLVTHALRLNGKTVLDIDCDPQGGLSGVLAPSSTGIIHLMLMGNTPQTIKALSGIDIITSGYELDKLYVTLDHLAFKRALKPIEGQYDYIVFDTPPTMQGITRAAAYVSDIIMVPCEVSTSAWGPTLYTLQCLVELEKKGYVLIVGNRHEGYALNIAAKMLDSFGDNYIGAIPRDITSQKIIAGECGITEAKQTKYIQPLYEIIKKLEDNPYRIAEEKASMAHLKFMQMGVE